MMERRAAALVVRSSLDSEEAADGVAMRTNRLERRPNLIRVATRTTCEASLTSQRQETRQLNRQ